MLEKLIIWCPSNDHLPFTKGKIVFEPFWNSFHFSIKCALLPTRGWTIKKVLNTATPWGVVFTWKYLWSALIGSMPWHFCQFSHFFAGGRVAMPVLIRAPWRHPGLHMSGYALTNHQVNTPQRSWNFRLTWIVPDHVSKSSFFLGLLHHITPKQAVPSEKNMRCSD